ncbi:MAG: sugar phosphate isomerase/epimerase [Bryobacteraceae bacterium]|nr:sugar phosphate isomerase/epimerase [Bryobacteraceae bacterium]
MHLSRRSLLASTLPATLLATPKKKIPIGIELYSVRNELKADPIGTVTRIGKMGYEVVEFFGPYIDYPLAQVKDLRKAMDDVNLRCLSTHNSGKTLFDSLEKAIEYNQILGSNMLIQSSAGGKMAKLDDWKALAGRLSAVGEKLKAHRMRTGFHNHELEFQPLEGQLPIEVLAANTGKDFILQLDVGTCVAVGQDPVAYIQRHKGRVRSIHAKDWGKEKGFRVLLGEGSSPWKELLKAAETVGGLEVILVEQEGADLPPFEVAERCLATMRKYRA